MQRHGYVFSALFGAISVALVMFGLELSGIDPRISAKDLPSSTLALCFVGVLFCGGVSYCISLVLSDMLYRARRK